ncbi:hypothetical protein FOMPIDRAFT_1031892 [Fomitopsis schrenkii]|uniref:Endonuclease/exonuclease/phosphatase domain-containing protein n=1 Tax=Fomitopsis schrenkii TaxID=2126942 RepID=S8FGX7_FOMSC|nr:hypothetical protein FOMPIDRAFT_1031892 [Fomitopsis schrenkii]
MPTANGGGQCPPAARAANEVSNGSESGATATQNPPRRSGGEGRGRGTRVPREQRNPENEARNTQTHRGRHTKASITIASLNISGRGQISDATPLGKWNALNQTMRERKIGAIALQETHLDTTAVNQIHNLYGRRLRVFYSEGQNATAAEGVAIVLNREIVDLEGVKQSDLIPGRAIYLEMKWHKDSHLRILNIYAPNTKEEQLAFWPEIAAKMRNKHLPTPDVILGDFNVVEEAIDRLPVREDDNARVEALREFIRPTGLIDGWRLTEPTTKDYTFPVRGSMSRSRLDRIYVPKVLLDSSSKWEITTTGIPTDHRMIIAALSTAQAPHVGHGRWTMPLHLMDDKKFLDAAVKLGEQAEKKLATHRNGQNRSTEQNPQRIAHSYKTQIKALAQARAKEKTPYLQKELAKLRKSSKKLMTAKNYNEDLESQKKISLIQDKIQELELRRSRQLKLTSAANYALNREAPSKYWLLAA